ncbi:MAG: 30S ribosomal protein S11 [Alphaproteobacteria bacterium]
MAIVKKKKAKKRIVSGIAHVLATFNNTRITITDLQGNVVAWATAGGQGFKGAKKSTPYAAQITADVIAKKAMEMGLQNIDVKINGAGGGADSAVRGLSSAGLKVGVITNITKVPHNGCRPKKARRV